MKVIRIYSNEKQLIRRAAKGNRAAQQTIFEKFSPKMLSVCRMYIKDLHFAEDVMVNGFLKVFSNLDRFEHRGSFEGWMRRIMVNESITFLRKKQFVVYDDGVLENNDKAEIQPQQGIDVDHIQKMIDRLPEGYKMVFVLNAIEGYKHHEIAEMLGISVGTSKSQLSKARKMLQENLKLIGVTSHSKVKS